MQRSGVGTSLLALFLGGLLGLSVVPRWVAAHIGDEPLGQVWVAWLAAPACLLVGWLAVPWLVRIQGGAALVDADMRREAERTRQQAEDRVPFLSKAFAWLVTSGVEGSLRATSLRRRYGHLALMPLPTLLLVCIVAVELSNSAWSGPYEEAHCTVVRAFANQ